MTNQNVNRNLNHILNYASISEPQRVLSCLIYIDSYRPVPFDTEHEDTMATSQPSLPARKAFVVQLHAEAQIEHGHFKGRVEHIVSHQAKHFESLEELVAFMVQVLMEQQKP